MWPREILHPSMYHGFHKKPPFFEGWYYKLVSADEREKIAIIPGVILGSDAHAFIQMIDGVSGTTQYFSYPLEQFKANPTLFDISVDENHFDSTQFSLNINRPEGQLSGTIRLGHLNPWPVSLLSPGVMGWYAYVPRMECYHGVLSFDHALEGKINFNGRTIDFSGGRGYFEKDWGKSFPAAWVWLQSNHFDHPAVCITGSVAIIPWLGRSFRGFIVGFWLNGALHRFTTYSGAHIEALEISDTYVDWVLRNRTHRLTLKAYRAQGGLLRGPTPMDMGQRVIETLNATIQVKLETLQGELLFDEVGANAGLEVIGDLARLLKG